MLMIGSLPLPHPFVQAALSGYSDLPMRRLARSHGAAYALNEVVLDKSVLQPGKLRREILRVADDDHPVGGQLMGAEPELFGRAARDLAQAGYDVIDINFGCPVRKVLGRCRGGFLLSQPNMALDIIRRVYDAVGAVRPVTVKMRRGADHTAASERNFLEILDGAFSIGVAGFPVHGRTVEQRYVGASDWSFLTRVKRRVGDKVILGSGDLFTAHDCVRMMETTGIDGVTIARGCIGNPWIFQECRALWSGQPLPPPPTIQQQRETIAEHWRLCLHEYGPAMVGKIMRKFGVKYSEHHPCHLSVRNAFLSVASVDDFENVLAEWYSPVGPWPEVRRREGVGDLVAAGACE